MSDGKEEPKPEQAKSGGVSWTGAPQHYGNLAGDKMESTLGKVGQPVGKGLSYATAPVGNVVDSLVGGVMRGGELANDAPKHGEGVESSIRDMAGKLTGQAQEVMDKGQDGVGEQGQGKIQLQEMMDKGQEALGGDSQGNGQLQDAIRKGQEAMKGEGQGKGLE